MILESIFNWVVCVIFVASTIVGVIGTINATWASDRGWFFLQFLFSTAMAVGSIVYLIC